MFTGILYTHIFYALGGSEMPNGQNLRPIAARLARAVLDLKLDICECDSVKPAGSERKRKKNRDPNALIIEHSA